MDVKDLYLTGVASMLIASKFEEIRPLSMRELIEDVSHFNFSKVEINEKEIEILVSLQFSVNIPLAKSFLDQTLLVMDGQIQMTSQFIRIIECLSHLACYSYKL